MTKQNRLRSCAIGALLTSSFTMAAALPAGAVPKFDGLWSVVIVTEKGSCDRAYRYPIRISNGTVSNAGGNSFTITGKVKGTGDITVKVSHGSKSASGVGRFSGNEAFGRWSGGECAGTWSAERRDG
jgi:hypothetical protein